MSTLKVNALNNGGSAIDLPNSFKLGGNPIEQGYTSSATEPTSPNTGDLWWDSANEKLYQYLNGEFKEITLSGPVSWSVDLSNVSYDSVSFSVSGQDGSCLGVTFNTDGTKMYVVGNTSDTIFQYSLSTGFDLSTASYDSVSLSVSSRDSTPYGIVFNTDGTKMYLMGNATDTVYQYSLSTGFDLSTASYDSVSFSVTSQDTFAAGIAFNTDGTKMYMIGPATDSVYQYSLSTGFDLSTASYDSVSFSVSSQDSSPIHLVFNSDGTKMYVMGNSTDTVFQYGLSTGFDLSTASYDSASFYVNSQDTNARAIAFSADGTKMYMVGNTNDTVFQYSTGL